MLTFKLFLEKLIHDGIVKNPSGKEWQEFWVNADEYWQRRGITDAQYDPTFMRFIFYENEDIFITYEPILHGELERKYINKYDPNPPKDNFLLEGYLFGEFNKITIAYYPSAGSIDLDEVMDKLKKYFRSISVRVEKFEKI